jgi:hypothetical protein
LASTRHFRRLLYDLAGAVTDTSMNVDGSSTAVVFHSPVGRGQTMQIDRLVFVIESTGMDWSTSEIQDFGAVGAALGTGVTCTHLQGTLTTDIFLEAVQSMADFYRYIDSDSVVNLVDGVAAGTDTVTFEVTLSPPAFLKHEYARATAQDNIACKVSDDLTSLTDFKVFAVGTLLQVEDGLGR